MIDRPNFLLRFAVVPIWRYLSCPASVICDNGKCGSLVNDLGSYHPGIPGSAFPLGGFVGALLASNLFAYGQGRKLYLLRSTVIIGAAIYLILAAYVSEAIVGKFLIGVGFGVADVAWVFKVYDQARPESSGSLLITHVFTILVMPVFHMASWNITDWILLRNGSLFMLIILGIVLYELVTRYFKQEVNAEKTHEFVEPKSEGLGPQVTTQDYLIGLYDSKFFLSMASTLFTSGGMAFITYFSWIFEGLLPWFSDISGKEMLRGGTIVLIPLFAPLCISFFAIIVGEKHYPSTKQILIFASVSSFASSALAAISFFKRSELAMFIAEFCASMTYTCMGVPGGYLRSVAPEHILPASIVYILMSWLFIAIGSAVFSVLFTSLGSSAFICLSAGSLTVATLQAILM